MFKAHCLKKFQIRYSKIFMLLTLKYFILVTQKKSNVFYSKRFYILIIEKNSYSLPKNVS